MMKTFEHEAHMMFTLMDIRELISHIGYEGFQQALSTVLNASKEAREFTADEKAFMQGLLDNWKH
jgi:hypothetical protein